MVKIIIPGILLFLCSISTFAQDDFNVTYLIVKYGDEAATPELAGEFLDKLAAYLETHTTLFNKKVVQGFIANTPDSADALLQSHRPKLVFCSVDFYLDYLSSSGYQSSAIAQIPRNATNFDRYYLVTGKSGPTLAELKNGLVRTKFAYSINFFKNVVFPRKYQPGVYFKLEPAENLADEVFLIIENSESGFNSGDIGSASALLLDEELKHFFEEDEFTWPELKIIWQSELLPPGLVFAVGSGWTEKKLQALSESLLKMPDRELGAEILGMMQSTGLKTVNEELLHEVTRKYRGHK